MGSLKTSDTHSSARSIIAFFIVLIAFGILALFKAYKDSILQSNGFGLFMFLTFSGMALLLCLLYLVGQTKTSAKSHRKRK